MPLPKTASYGTPNLTADLGIEGRQFPVKDQDTLDLINRLQATHPSLI
jgi:hypothetical protein